MAIACFLLILQSITGYYMWWKRLRSKSKVYEPEAVSESVA
jgi:uncharacterized iron-regulated membrane protein